MDFGSSASTGLKWMAINACFSLRSQNVDSMTENGISPFNDDLHFMLGAETITYTDKVMAGKWANYMVQTNLTVWDAWTRAGREAFQTVPASTVIRFAWWGHGDNLGDQIQSILGGTSGEVSHDGVQVHPFP